MYSYYLARIVILSQSVNIFERENFKFLDVRKYVG